jgi:hypothetical protein
MKNHIDTAEWRSNRIHWFQMWIGLSRGCSLLLAVIDSGDSKQSMMQIDMFSHLMTQGTGRGYWYLDKDWVLKEDRCIHKCLVCLKCVVFLGVVFRVEVHVRLHGKAATVLLLVQIPSPNDFR